MRAEVRRRDPLRDERCQLFQDAVQSTVGAELVAALLGVVDGVQEMLEPLSALAGRLLGKRVSACWGSTGTQKRAVETYVHVGVYESRRRVLDDVHREGVERVQRYKQADDGEVEVRVDRVEDELDNLPSRLDGERLSAANDVVPRLGNRIGLDRVSYSHVADQEAVAADDKEAAVRHELVHTHKMQRYNVGGWRAGRPGKKGMEEGPPTYAWWYCVERNAFAGKSETEAKAMSEFGLQVVSAS